MKRLLLLLAALAISTLSVTAAPRTESDIAYLGTDRAEKLDAWLPDPAVWSGPHPSVLFIHGGGWQGGDKANDRERNIGQNLSAAGYAVFSVNYLLNTREKDPVTGQIRTTRFAWPQNLYDCKTAIRYLRAESARFGIDPARIAVMGGSGGARLAQLLGATVRHDEFNRHGLYTEQSNAIACILSFYGNYDIRGTHHFADGGLPTEELAAKQAEASAITWIDKHTPPVVITHGSADKTTPVESSRLLAEHLRRLGVDYWYVEIAGAPHSFHLQPKQMDLRPTVLAFLAKHLGQPVPAVR
ncbi:MAG: alpha/beta hydrolase [Opitutaceae bacterium]|jgi:acetyl esterase/lipase|nr:alpha/beta hydrolase [Opitutaceae bacterium]